MRHMIPVENLGKLVKKIDALNRKAARLGLTPVHTEATGHEEWRVIGHVGGEPVAYRHYVEIDVVGAPVVLADWKLLARIEHSAAGNICRTLPGQEVPEQYWDAPNACDHCGHRRRRKDTFILENADGSLKQVGRTCLQDHLGDGVDPQVLADTLSVIRAAERLSSGFRGERVEYVLDAPQVVAVAASVIRQHGWISSASARRSGHVSTASEVRGIYSEFTVSGEWEAPTAKDIEVGNAALAWASALSPTSDYESNIKAIADSGKVGWGHIALTASIVGVYLKKQAETEETEERVNEHVGTVGERLDLVLTVEGIRGFESDFGWTTVVKFRDADGRSLTWFASNSPRVERGQTLKVRGTVKKHGEYRGTKQTTLNRCVLQPVKD